MNEQDAPRVGDRVVVRNTLMFNGATGTLVPSLGDPYDFWAYNAILDDVRRIGVDAHQVARLDQEVQA